MNPVRRRTAALALLLLVTALHGWIAGRMAESRLGAGAADTRPRRLEVAFVRTLAPTAPVAVAAAPPPPARAPATPKPAPAASAASAVPESPPTPPPVAELEASVPVPETVAQPAAAPTPPPTEAQGSVRAAASAASASASATASASVLPSAPASAAVATFDWPPSTRLSYSLKGNFRGPVDGRAQVQWLRDGQRYQVHLDVDIGPGFAPLVTRQMSSDGTLGPDGLVPRRYDERTKVAFRDARIANLQFDGAEVQLANGRRVPQPRGVQDTVSQFVQLTWRFTLKPDLLRPGQVLEVPLALPRRVETWTYDVREPETLLTPAGPVEAVRVQPRREARTGGDLVAEMWFAPTLQYLPVRIVIRQDAETFIDLLVDRLPEQAGPGPVQPPASTPKRLP